MTGKLLKEGPRSSSFAAFSFGSQKFPDIPHVIGQSALHRGRDPERLVDTAGVVQANMGDAAWIGPSVELGLHKVTRGLPGFPRGMTASDINIGDMPHFGPMITLTLPGAEAGPAVGIAVTPKGQPGVALVDSKGRDRADISLSAAGEPNITLSDSAGYSMDLGSTTTVTPATGQTQQTSAASIVMFSNDKKHHVIWQAPQ